MKNLVLVFVAIAVLSSCATQRKIDGLNYGADFDKSTLCDNFKKEQVQIGSEKYYFTQDYKMFNIDDAKNAFNPITEKIDKVYSYDPFVLVKISDGVGGYIDAVELPEVKVKIEKGKLIRYNIWEQTNCDVEFGIPKIILDKEYYYTKWNGKDLSRIMGIRLNELQEYIIMVALEDVDRVEIPEGRGRVSIVAHDNIYVYIPQSLATKSMHFMFGYPTERMAIIENVNVTKKVIHKKTVSTKKISKSSCSIKKKHYHVKPGDSMYKIASKHKMSPKYLISINSQIKNPDRIKVGEVVYLKK